MTFGYVKGMKDVPVLVLLRGVCLDGAADKKKARLKDALRKLSETLLPKPAPEKYDTDVSGITFHDKVAQTLQQKVAADPALDGALILGASYDAKGSSAEGFVPEGADAKKRLDTLLGHKLKGTGLLAPEADTPDPLSLDHLTALDWQGPSRACASSSPTTARTPSPSGPAWTGFTSPTRAMTPATGS